MWGHLTDKERMEFARNEYGNYSVGKRWKIHGKSVGYVQQRIGFNKDGSPNINHAGEQAYVVTNTRNPHKATEVAVVYRGSDTDFKHSPKDVCADWGNDIVAGIRIFFGSHNKTVLPQFKAAAKTLDNVCRKYPHASVYVFGQSLGSMDGQYGVCRTKYPQRIKGGYFYEGPNIYDALTFSEKLQAFKLRHRIHNYQDGKDIVSMGYGLLKPSIGQVIYIDSTETGNVPDQHMWGGYRFNRNDSLKTLSVEQEQLLYAENDYDRLINLTNFIFGNKEVKVDPGDVVSIANVLTAAVEEALTMATSEVKREESFFEENWQHVQQMARAIGTDLSMGEIMDALAAGGATQASMVAQPQEICEQELHQLVSAAERLTSLGSGMRSAAGNFEATDSKISQMIGE